MVAIWSTYLAFGVFFKPVITEFGWTRALTSGAFSLSMIMQGLLGIVMGALNDRFGPRRVMTFCGFFLGLGYLLMSQITSIWQLYLFYGVIIGTGMGGCWIPLLSTIARWFVKRRTIMTGIVVTGGGIGGLAGPLLSNWLISTYDWQASYIILGSAVLVIVISGAQFLRRDPSQMRQVPYGENEGEERDLKAGTQGFSLKEAVYTRKFWMASAMLCCFGYCLFSITVHLVPHATDLGISAVSAASILAAMGGLSIAGNIVLGSVGDRIGNRRVFIIGFILMSASLFWLVPAREMWMLYLFAVAMGFAHGGMGASESPLVAGLFGLKSHGLIFGVIGMGFTIGAAIGPFLSGSIFDATGSYQTSFLVCACIGIVGLVLAVLLTRIKGEQGKAKTS